MHRRFILSVIAVVLVAAIGITAVWITTTEPSAASENLGPLDQPVSANLMARLNKISTQGLQETPNLNQAAMKRIHAGSETSGGTPLVLYVGADFCPYCAALRWPLTLTLMRFGDLSGLRYTRSNGRDVYPNTATFTFSSAHLKSDVIDFQETELEDRDRKALQTLDSSAHTIFEAFDKKPYTQYPGSIPFLVPRRAIPRDRIAVLARCAARIGLGTDRGPAGIGRQCRLAGYYERGESVDGGAVYAHAGQAR